MSVLTELRDARELFWNLTLREVRGKYKRTWLGHGWSLLNPLAQMLIFTVVFGFVLRADPGPGDPSGVHNFALWLASALLPWAFMANAMTTGMNALVGNANLIQKVYFPREVLVASTVCSWIVSFAIELMVLVAALLLFGARPLRYLPVVVVFVALLTATALGLALALSVANVYFRDTQHFVALIVQIWFYATPIIYPEALVTGHEDIPDWVDQLYRLNPMERFAAVFRNLMYDNRLPNLVDSLFCVGTAAVALVGGYLAFRRFEARVAEEL